MASPSIVPLLLGLLALGGLSMFCVAELSSRFRRPGEPPPRATLDVRRWRPASRRLTPAGAWMAGVGLVVFAGTTVLVLWRY